MGSFADILANNPAPKRVGDVALRYEPSLLIGEADKPVRGLLFTLSWLLGTALGVGTVGALLSDAPTWIVEAVGLGTAASFAAAAVLDQRSRRQRRFVLNFETTSLRLDFSTPFANRPRTLVVHFDGVRDCALYAQADGRRTLTVDFVPAADSADLLREVLVANISPAEDEAAARLQRVLSGAFGLGARPAAPEEA